MFSVAGIETLAGGDTGSEPYKGKKGAERWQKMRENVIKEWETEQTKEVETATVQPDKSAVVRVDANEEHHREEKDIKSGSSKMQKLKEKLFRH
ncbi:hypothetical protein HBI56_186460 [Parastagonospora nodorum]|uniref:Uncharacterized protein n=1 Tax=Phaeosphaeria nodorum (strain SN15 / ATCC MYA-4574 / FGSC 10173) TaxID=321614 RepID=Q0U8R6_PHANO|nr:hypothetical protein SNOG_11848 [Parastagonospora nodorum SN15]KAH3909330.1 hypothetical protein HBH56_163130 [Parastagonospora nodorum]EAT80892.1 hypothetical protein SNOG_11848 [Parastagonospora nodorum SN15]KAH3932138.1 hypothetical protein HBH54_086110 [Parastagonospora nodorum]KAH3947676.1 hypothetical protein HBH53_113390 [Parastagonospora nodorum]KAH3993904.1 hypothetical protein HBI10_196930 [Parastagonospora nodorum]